MISFSWCSCTRWQPLVTRDASILSRQSLMISLSFWCKKIVKSTVVIKNTQGSKKMLSVSVLTWMLLLQYVSPLYSYFRNRWFISEKLVKIWHQQNICLPAFPPGLNGRTEEGKLCWEQTKQKLKNSWLAGLMSHHIYCLLKRQSLLGLQKWSCYNLTFSVVHYH